MSYTQYELSCRYYKNNICRGLSILQQNGEFVDMTLAADGHFVKVHRVVISLASPYLKQLLTSAPNPHPILIFNDISHKTLSLILEYIYSGEVLMYKENVKDVLQAGKALHIVGLTTVDISNEDFGEIIPKPINTHKTPVVKVVTTPTATHTAVSGVPTYKNASAPTVIRAAGNVPRQLPRVLVNSPMNVATATLKPHTTIAANNSVIYQMMNTATAQSNAGNRHGATHMNRAIHLGCGEGNNFQPNVIVQQTPTMINNPIRHGIRIIAKPKIKFTLSNQGNAQMILNRYIYYLRYNKKTNPPVRIWKCIDYPSVNCPASVTTRDDVVVQRTGAHQHPFHDKKILQHVQSGRIFTTLKDIEEIGGRVVEETYHTENAG